MLTSAIITLAKKEFPDWSDELIRTFLNELQRMVFTQNATAQMRIYDSSTGVDPKLATTSGVYEYEINTSAGLPYDAWRVYEVYSNEIDDPEDVLTIDATASSSNAKVVFPKDPGTGTYYVRCYRFPTQITANSVQLEIPHAYHLSHVYTGLCGLIEQARTGRSERWEKFERVLLPDLIKRMSDGRRMNHFTPYRSCGQ